MSKRTNPAPPNARMGNPVVSRSKQIKLVLLGESGVGKSSIALRYVRGEFNEHGEATIGAAFLTKTINVNGCAIKFDIWDTAGQERYHSLAPMYYRGAPAAVVVYDVCSMNSFNRATLWVKELLQQTSQMVIVLAGNKADMAGENRGVTKEEGKDFADEHGLIFAETSAKTGMNVEDIFQSVAVKLASDVSSQAPGGGAGGGKNVKLKNDSEKKGCC